MESHTFLCEIIPPVSGVCKSEEYDVKKAGEFSLQSLADMVLQFLQLPWALSGGLGLHTKQQIKKGLGLLDD